ncbi:UDP-3-O-acyl-N-acetylglucosamine deacetylase [Sulfitobacter sp. KE29]|uniref:UDP-3-O-acyl-N-acetylglucosamine deacetylase n=1 Tax=Sulfitobacter TaxID=60136 RepID=UPI0007C3E236|nr:MULTISPECIES: UDP-3-O-acyl-N-acetylglucosamine deacetylase [unclassified Sulfitobacter]MBO9437059.1 UDP-3-O-acyl-N-acetylglucosamine deacetylase [Sulfitobacter sp. R18_2]MDH4540897.1 UDP-3-O-acyl-N-acetylglucosamine deacetylase [Sulfitobacter faviae]KZY52623.1 UDP-3-O-[3-hydroxymyristoyl] N-acetylglucosamine deacetylase [Sulfitobacter sp. HI0054]MDF3418069.1 UDP-3-O-acyl-N-acetylglucosamine deacetylase [Sulfitobacter sp. Ks38]MDF3425551.1 UDP-3-O-acyl-N-acetylglucosamine deacetylase [Sulfit
MQTTIKSAVSFTGTGLHSGLPATVTLRPASAHHGIWFSRSDVAVGDRLIPARWDAVNRSPLCTKLENPTGLSISTVEHLMAAVAGCGIHNLLIEIDGPEVPILDGSSLPFVRGIMQRGLRQLAAPVMAFEVLKTVTVQDGDAVATISPADTLRIDFEIDFADAAIGQQRKSLVMNNGSFARELCDSRTFCRQADVEAMQANGLALGGEAGENAVVFDGDAVVSPGGLRHADEPVRHKMLDALGDLALAGAPLLGHYEGKRAGHSLTNTLLRALFATPDAVRLVACDAAQTARLPGSGLIWNEIPQVA